MMRLSFFGILLLISTSLFTSSLECQSESQSDLERLASGNITSIMPIDSFNVENIPIRFIKWSPDGNIFVVVSNESVQLYESNTWQVNNVLTQDLISVNAADFNSDGSLIALAGSNRNVEPTDNFIMIQDSSTGKIVNSIELTYLDQDEFIYDVSFTPDDSAIMIVTYPSHKMTFWSTFTGELISEITLTSDTSPRFESSFSPTGEYFSLGSPDFGFYLWQVFPELQETDLNLPYIMSPYMSSSFSSDESMLTISNWYGDTITIIPFQSQLRLQTESVYETGGRVDVSTFTPDDHMLISALHKVDMSLPIMLSFWDANTAELLYSISLDSDYSAVIKGLSVSSDGTKLVSIDASGKGIVWGVKS